MEGANAALAEERPPPVAPEVDDLPDDGPVDDWRRLPLALAPDFPAPEPHRQLPPEAVRAFGSARCRPIQALPTFSPDGTRIAGASSRSRGVIEGTVWEFPGGRQVCRFRLDGSGELTALRFSPDGLTLLAVARTSGNGGPHEWGEIRRFDAATGAPVGRPAPFEFYRPMRVAVPANCAAVFVSQDSQSVSRLDPDTGRAVWRYAFPVGWDVGEVGAAPDGTRVAVSIWGAHKPSTVVVLDGTTGREIGRLNALPSLQGIPAFSPDGKSLALPCWKVAFTVWDLRTLTRTAIVRTGLWGSKFVYSPDGKWCAAGSSSSSPIGSMDSSVVVYDTATWKPAYTVPIEGYGGEDFAFTPDSKTLAIATGGLSLFDAPTGRLQPRSSDPANMGVYNDLWFSPDGAKLSGYSNSPPQISSWDIASGRELGRPAIAGSWWSRHDRFWLSQPYKSPVMVADVETGRVVSSFNWPVEPPRCNEWHLSANGRFLFAGFKETVERYDARTGKHLGRLADFTGDEKQPSDRDLVVLPSPCGRFVAVTRGYRPTGPVPVRIYDAATGKKLGEWATQPPRRSSTWSADGERLALGTVHPNEDAATQTTRVTVWSVPLGRIVSRVTFADPVWVGTFSPDLRTVTAWDERVIDGSVRLYETATGRLRHTFDTQEQWYGRSEFSPNGRLLVTSHPGTPVLLWDVRGEKSARTNPPDAAGWAKAWDALAGDDPKAAFDALRTFAAFPDQGLPVLRAKIQVPVPPDPMRVTKLIDELGAADFKDREMATSELERLGDLVEPALRGAVKAHESPEVRGRAGRLLAPLPVMSPITVRAVEVAEWVNTPAAVTLLRYWATGPENAQLTSEAKAALSRLNAN